MIRDWPVMREQTLEPSLLLPEFTPYGVRWHPDDSVGRVLYKLRRGDPTKGWEGDARLELYFHRDRDRWALLRLEWDGEQRLVKLLPPGVAPDESLIEMLVRHDVRRGYDIEADVTAANERIDRDNARKRHELEAETVEHVQYLLDRGRVA